MSSILKEGDFMKQPSYVNTISLLGLIVNFSELHPANNIAEIETAVIKLYHTFIDYLNEHPDHGADDIQPFFVDAIKNAANAEMIEIPLELDAESLIEKLSVYFEGKEFCGSSVQGFIITALTEIQQEKQLQTILNELANESNQSDTLYLNGLKHILQMEKISLWERLKFYKSLKEDNPNLESVKDAIRNTYQLILKKSNSKRAERFFKTLAIGGVVSYQKEKTEYLKWLEKREHVKQLNASVNFKKALLRTLKSPGQDVSYEMTNIIYEETLKQREILKQTRDYVEGQCLTGTIKKACLATLNQPGIDDYEKLYSYNQLKKETALQAKVEHLITSYQKLNIYSAMVVNFVTLLSSKNLSAEEKLVNLDELRVAYLSKKCAKLSKEDVFNKSEKQTLQHLKNILDETSHSPSSRLTSFQEQLVKIDKEKSRFNLYNIMQNFLKIIKPEIFRQKENMLADFHLVCDPTSAPTPVINRAVAALGA